MKTSHSEELRAVLRLLGTEPSFDFLLEVNSKKPEIAAVIDAQSLAKQAGFVIGAKIKFLLMDGMTGIVVGYNKSTRFGVVSGNDAPLLITRSDGYTFEYGLNEVELEPLAYMAGVLVNT